MDGNALVALVKSFLDPAATAGLMIIPSAFVVYMMVEGIKFFASDDREHDKEPFMKKLKNALLVTIILFSLTAILKIFGISV